MVFQQYFRRPREILCQFKVCRSNWSNWSKFILRYAKVYIYRTHESSKFLIPWWLYVCPQNMLLRSNLGKVKLFLGTYFLESNSRECRVVRLKWLISERFVNFLKGWLCETLVKYIKRNECYLRNRPLPLFPFFSSFFEKSSERRLSFCTNTFEAFWSI